MDRRAEADDWGAVGSQTDYRLWALCSFLLFVGLGFVQYNHVKSGFWQECVWLVRGRHNVDPVLLTGVGLVIGATAASVGWLLHIGIAECFGRRRSRPPDEAADYDDKPPPAG
jgi:hypothetical protein